jgi:hypothetical protein
MIAVSIFILSAAATMLHLSHADRRIITLADHATEQGVIGETDRRGPARAVGSDGRTGGYGRYPGSQDDKQD